MTIKVAVPRHDHFAERSIPFNRWLVFSFRLSSGRFGAEAVGEFAVGIQRVGGTSDTALGAIRVVHRYLDRWSLR